MQRGSKIIRSFRHAALVAACAALCSVSSAHLQTRSLQEDVRTIERAMATRSLSTIREYLNPKKTFIDILGKPASYLSVNQSVAVIESFLRQNTPTAYALSIIKEGDPTSIAISSLRVKSTSGERSLKVTLGFSKDRVDHWLINRIIIR